jgi:hypothetical protein
VPEVENGVLVVPQHPSRMIDRFERHKRHPYAGQEIFIFNNDFFSLLNDAPGVSAETSKVSLVGIFF